MDILFFYAYLVAFIFVVTVVSDLALRHYVKPYGRYLRQTFFFCTVPVFNLFLLVFVGYNVVTHVTYRVKTFFGKN